MSSTKAGIHHADYRIQLLPAHPSLMESKENPYDYVGSLFVIDRDEEGKKTGRREFYYTIKFNSVIISLRVPSSRQMFTDGIVADIAKSLRLPKKDVFLIEQGKAWIEDELWAVAHDWEQAHGSLVYHPMSLMYLGPKEEFVRREEAKWFTFDEAIQKRNSLMAYHHTEDFTVVARKDVFPTMY